MEPCRCGIDSIGVCKRCDLRVCGVHSSLQDQELICEWCSPTAIGLTTANPVVPMKANGPQEFQRKLLTKLDHLQKDLRAATETRDAWMDPPNLNPLAGPEPTTEERTDRFQQLFADFERLRDELVDAKVTPPDTEKHHIRYSNLATRTLAGRKCPFHPDCHVCGWESDSSGRTSVYEVSCWRLTEVKHSYDDGWGNPHSYGVRLVLLTNGAVAPLTSHFPGDKRPGVYSPNELRKLVAGWWMNVPTIGTLYDDGLWKAVRSLERSTRG